MVVTSLAERLAMWKGWLYSLARTGVGWAAPARREQHNLFDDCCRRADGAGHRGRPDEEWRCWRPPGHDRVAHGGHAYDRNMLAKCHAVRLLVRRRGRHRGQASAYCPSSNSYPESSVLLLGQAGTVHLSPRFGDKAVLQVIEKQRPQLVTRVRRAGRLNGCAQATRRLVVIRTVIPGLRRWTDCACEFERFGAHEVVEGYG